MVTAHNVADFFIDIAKNNENDTITNLRVNKLVYFAQAWYLTRYNIPLFNEEIEAWDYGPIVSSLYQVYKKYGKNNIDNVSDNYSSNIFSADELKTLIDVAVYYGKYSTTELVNLTHRKDSPWYKVMTSQNRTSCIISKESLKDYYQNQAPLTSFKLPTWMYEGVSEVRRNENGVIILDSDDEDWAGDDWEDYDA